MVCIFNDLFKKAFLISRSENYYVVSSDYNFFLLHLSLNTSEIIFCVGCGVRDPIPVFHMDDQ